MRTDRTLHALFIAALIFGLIMAFFGWEDSFSQNALQENDWALRLYLGCASLGFLGMSLRAENRKDSFTAIKWQVPWEWAYFSIALFFLFISATNVSQIYWLHIICTAIVAGLGYLMSWNYFTPGIKRYLAIGVNSLGAGFFVATWLFGVSTIAWGEVAISASVLGVVWVMINEQIK